MKRRLFDWLARVLERLLLFVDQRAPTLVRLGAVAKPKESIRPLPYHACLIPWQWLSRDGTSWQCPVCGALYSYLPTPRTAYVTEPSTVVSSRTRVPFSSSLLEHKVRSKQIVYHGGKFYTADHTPIDTGQLYKAGVR